jgi:hypothetical protein
LVDENNFDRKIELKFQYLIFGVGRLNKINDGFETTLSLLSSKRIQKFQFIKKDQLQIIGLD